MLTIVGTPGAYYSDGVVATRCGGEMHDPNVDKNVYRLPVQRDLEGTLGISRLMGAQN